MDTPISNQSIDNIITELEKITNGTALPYRIVTSTARHFLDEDDGLVSIPTKLCVFEQLDLLTNIRKKYTQLTVSSQLTRQFDQLIDRYRAIYKIPFDESSLTSAVKISLMKDTAAFIESLKKQRLKHKAEG